MDVVLGIQNDFDVYTYVETASDMSVEQEVEKPVEMVFGIVEKNGQNIEALVDIYVVAAAFVIVVDVENKDDVDKTI